MKIVTYTLLSCLVALAALCWYYASNQETTVRLLVGARSGFTSDPAGMVRVNKELVTEAATVAKSRSDLLKSNETRQAEALSAVEKLEDTRRVVEEHKNKVEELQNRNAEAEKNQDELATQKDALLAQLRSVPGLEDADMENAVDTLRSKVQGKAEDIAKLSEQNKKLTGQRKELNQAVSEATVEFNSKKEANDKFMETYSKNGVEYTVAAVNPQWHFVVFNAGEDSGFYPGDTTPLLVQRNGVAITTLRIVSVSGGQIVAEYDESTLPRGVTLEVGDQVLRKVPVGS